MRVPKPITTPPVMGFLMCGGSPMISVTVAAGEIQCTVEWDSKDWSPDVALDMARRAVASVVVACNEIEEPPVGEADVTPTGDDE